MAGTEASDPATGLTDRRKLVAVVYADMVGYSRLNGLDDTGPLNRLRTLRREVIDPAIEEHGGGIVQTGDGSLLIVFDSIDGAVRCAVQVQQLVRIRDDDSATARGVSAGWHLRFAFGSRSCAEQARSCFRGACGTPHYAEPEFRNRCLLDTVIE
jgi:class 3 adenylate cyclase